MQQVRPIVPHGREGRQHEYRPAWAGAVRLRTTMAPGGLIRVHCASDGPAPRRAPACPLPGTRRGTPAPAGGSFWYLNGDPAGASTLEGRASADVAIIGGGFTGLWTAIRLLEADPRCASSCSRPTGSRRAPAAATGLLRRVADHGLTTGSSTSPTSWSGSRRRASATCRELVAFVRNEGIDAELEETGTFDVAAEPWQVDGLREYVELAAEHGIELTFLDRDAIQAQVHFAALPGGRPRRPRACVMVNPAKLAWDSRTAAERRGARIAEHSRVRRLARRAGRVEVQVAGGGIVDAEHVIVGTSAYSAWMRRLAARSCRSTTTR